MLRRHERTFFFLVLHLVQNAELRLAGSQPVGTGEATDGGVVEVSDVVGQAGEESGATGMGTVELPAPITGAAFDAMEAGAGRRERTAAASRVARGVQIDGLYQAQGPLEGGQAAGGLENCIPLAVALHRLLVLLSCGFCELRAARLPAGRVGTLCTLGFEALLLTRQKL